MLPINTIIRDRYRIIYAIDERPAGQVYRARDEQSEKLVLIGAVPAPDDNARVEIEKIARQISAVRHDALLPFVDQFAESGSYVLICDDPGGQDLERRLRGGPLPEADVLAQVRRLIEATEELHAQRPPLLLGDLLPTDVWVTEDGAWRLVPFTLVRQIGDGPVPYRAPELLNTKVEPSSITDTYALTALCYHALTGWAPPTAEQQAAGTPLNTPRTLNPQLSTLIEQFLLRGLQQKAVNRYQNARELRLALETVQMMAGRSLGLGAEMLTSVTETPTVVSTPPPLQPVPVPPAAQPAPQPYPLSAYPPQPAPPYPPSAYPPQPQPAPGTPPQPAPGAPQPYPPSAYPPQPAPPYPTGVYTPLPGQPYPPGMYQAPPKKRGNGCLIASIVVLGLIVVVLCIAIALLLPGSPIRALLGGGQAASSTLAPPAGASTGQPPVAVSAKTITLQNAGQITQTTAISNVVSGPLAFSPDGATLAVGIGNTVSLRALSDNLRETHVLSGHVGMLSTLTFAPNGKLLASGAIDDRDVRLWDPTTGALLHTLSGHTGWLRSVAFSPDNKLLASGATDNSVRLWSTDTGQLVKTLTGHTDWVGGIAFAPDGNSLVSASRDGTVRLWDVSTGQQRAGFVFQMPKDTTTNKPLWATAVAFSPDGTQLAVGGIDAVVRLLNLQTGAELRQLRGHQSWIVIRGLAWSSDNRTLVSASLDGSIRSWDATSGTEKGNFVGHRLDLAGIALSSDGTALASASSREGIVILWNVANQQISDSLRIGQGVVTGLAYTPDSGTLGLVGYNGTVQIRKLAAARGQMLVGAVGVLQPLAFLSNDALVTISDQNSVVVVGRSAAAGQSLSGLDGQPLSVAASRDGNNVAAGSSTGEIVVWDASGKQIQTLHGDLKAIMSLSLSSDGTLLAAAGPASDPRIQVWDVAGGKAVQTFTDPQQGVASLAFQPRGTLFAATDVAGTLFVWDAQTGKQVYTQHPNTTEERFIGLAFSPDGGILAGGALNGDILFWDATNGKQAAQIAVPNSSVIALAFSPNGEQLALSVNSDGAPVYVYGLR